jgi:hypothetical protein
MSIWKIFAIFGIVSAWAERALADGKVTATEAAELVTALAGELGISFEIEVFKPNKAPEEPEKEDALPLDKINPDLGPESTSS